MKDDSYVFGFYVSLEVLVVLSLLLISNLLHLPLLLLLHPLLLLREHVLLNPFLLPLFFIHLSNHTSHWCFPQLSWALDWRICMISLCLSTQQVFLCLHKNQTFPFFHLLFWCSIFFQKLWSASHLLVFLSIACREFYHCCLWEFLCFECQMLYALPMPKIYLLTWNPLT